MIVLGSLRLDLSDPAQVATLAGGATLVLILLLLLVTLRRAGASARLAHVVADELSGLGRRVEGLSDGQQQLAGGLRHVSEAQAAQQARTLATVEARLAEVNARMGDSLAASARNTATSLGELSERLKTIDRAQENITKLSGDVLGLQDILSNKQARGAFGEIQLAEILSSALPPDSYSLQATLANGRRADCLIRLPKPPGPIAIDAKFPLEPYERLRAASGERDKADAARAFRTAVRSHLKAIAERYIVEGETADGAIMFLPSEAVYAELHANFGDLVREGFALRVYTVSPTTCMATLTTMRAILKDARMREQAGAIRATLRLLHRDVELVGERVGKLATHFDQARRDIDEIGTAAERAGKRADKLDRFDFAEMDEGTQGDVVALRRGDG